MLLLLVTCQTAPVHLVPVTCCADADPRSTSACLQLQRCLCGFLGCFLSAVLLLAFAKHSVPSWIRASLCEVVPRVDSQHVAKNGRPMTP